MLGVSSLCPMFCAYCTRVGPMGVTRMNICPQPLHDMLWRGVFLEPFWDPRICHLVPYELKKKWRLSSTYSYAEQTYWVYSVAIGPVATMAM